MSNLKYQVTNKISNFNFKNISYYKFRMEVLVGDLDT
jgi:hypothetical protein